MAVSICENCDNMEFMARYPDKFFSLAIIDPPYGINVNMNAGRKKDTRSIKRTVKKWDNEAPNESFFDELRRVSKNQIIFGANHMIDKIKLNSQGWIFWDKCVAPGCSFSDGELAWTSFNIALKKAVIPYSGFIGSEGEKFHPTTKPIKLYKWILKKYHQEIVMGGVKSSTRTLDLNLPELQLSIWDLISMDANWIRITSIKAANALKTTSNNYNFSQPNGRANRTSK